MTKLQHNSWSIERADVSTLPSFNFDSFIFGTTPTDHVVEADFVNGAWTTGKIHPYKELTISPLAMALHYGQTVFEGIKAYKQDNGETIIFRLHKHFERMNRSLERMAMPTLPEDLFMDGIRMIVEMEKDWAISREGYSLYIRPFVYATEGRLGVAASSEYKYMVVCSPMAAYYAKPLKVKVEREFTRAVKGGVGFVKTGGNYGRALYPTRLAQQEGFDQVIWTDADEHEYVEESGTMNLMFVIDGTLITPALSGTILDGVTRDSLLTIARAKGIPVEERKLSLTELKQAFERGAKVEAFGAGTAAIIAPIELIRSGDDEWKPYTGEDALMYTLKKDLQDIRYGRTPDVHNWIVPTLKV